ncbi:MAG: hypothetical protein Q7K41_02025, partial [Dehalococcoidales bacterium]|nr:hypothetical protein [Dehalococcoidales bacterium]
MSFDPLSPALNQSFTIKVVSTIGYVNVKLTGTDPTGSTTFFNYAGVSGGSGGNPYIWKWTVQKALAGTYSFTFKVNQVVDLGYCSGGDNGSCASKTLTFNVTPWIQAIGDVHANDRIRASGGPNPISGVVCPTQAVNPRVTGGLISTYGLSENFGNPEAICVTGNKAPFVPYKIPTYDDLKSLYYTQARQPAGIVAKHPPLIITEGDGATQADIPMTAGSDHLYYIKKTNPTSIDGNLTISGNIPGGGSQTGVVFVDGNLNINTNLTHS